MTVLMTKITNIVVLMLFANALKMIPTSLKIAYINDKYLENASANVRRYTRNGDAYFSLWGTSKHTWANNVTINLIVTEFLHNEYRRSFIEFHYKFCELLNKQDMFGKMITEKGIVCPLPQGRYYLMNMTVQSQDFPNQWPFEKGGVDINMTITKTGESICAGSVYVLFQQTKNKKIIKT